MAERDARGRFIKGSCGNPAGRPPRLTEGEYLDVLKDTIPPDRWTRIIEAVARRAERGDVAAFRALAGYLAGLPLQRVAATVRADDAEELSDADRAVLRAYLDAPAAPESNTGSG